MKFALRERFLTPIASSSRSLTNVRGNGEKVEIFSMDFIFAGTVFVALFIFLPQRNQRKRSLGFSLVKFQLSTINYKLSCFSLRRRRGALNFFFFYVPVSAVSARLMFVERVALLGLVFYLFVTQGFRPGLKEVALSAPKICSRRIKSQ